MTEVQEEELDVSLRDPARTLSERTVLTSVRDDVDRMSRSSLAAPAAGRRQARAFGV